MVKKKTKGSWVHLVCSECKERNYYTSKSKAIMQSKLELKKYCPTCRKHTLHRESK
ncbi:MAG: 50S ribosomal protein L33 [bacterium]